MIIQTKPNIEKILNGPYLRQFYIDIEDDTNLYDTSDKHLVVYNNGNRKFSLITFIKWSSYLNTFFVLRSQLLSVLNGSPERFNMYPIYQSMVINEIF
jgi:hypothetical protein